MSFAGDNQVFNMQEHVCWIGVDPECSSFLQLCLAVASRQQPYAKRSLASGGKHVPGTVADDNTVFDRHSQTLRSENEYIGRGFRFYHVVASDHHGLRRDLQVSQQTRRLFSVPCGGDRPADTGLPQIAKQFSSKILCARLHLPGGGSGSPVYSVWQTSITQFCSATP